MPLILRADANSRIGTGHVMRCIALGQTWRAGDPRTEIKGRRSGGRAQGSETSSVVFICSEIPDSLAERLKSEGFDLIRVDAEPGTPDDIRQTLEAVSTLSSDPNPFSPQSREGEAASEGWLVLDGYHFDLEYQRSIRRLGHKLLLIDDYNHLPEYECDILLNQNINALELDYTINPDARLLLGTDYAMLRGEFFQCRRGIRPVQGEQDQTVLVTLGGADPDNVTLKVIKALQQLDAMDLHTKIIIGSANPHYETLKKAVADSAFDLQLLTDVEDMPEVMNWADLAISAAGSTCWELCCLGVPFVTLVLAENQRGLAAGLDARGVATCLGGNPSVHEISAAVGTLRKDEKQRICCSEKGRELVDGLGAARVLNRPAGGAGLDLFAERLSLRPVDKKDTELLWRWANDPAVRANAYQTDPIPMDDHLRWVSNKLDSSDSLLLILELDGCPVGQVRYDRTDCETAEIDFSIDRQFRGLGLGRRMIELSTEEAARQLEVSKLHAQVKEGNEPSCRVFQRAGFQRLEHRKTRGVSSVRVEMKVEEAE